MRPDKRCDFSILVERATAPYILAVTLVRGDEEEETKEEEEEEEDVIAIHYERLRHFSAVHRIPPTYGNPGVVVARWTFPKSLGPTCAHVVER